MPVEPLYGEVESRTLTLSPFLNSGLPYILPPPNGPLLWSILDVDWDKINACDSIKIAGQTIVLPGLDKSFFLVNPNADASESHSLMKLETLNRSDTEHGIGVTYLEKNVGRSGVGVLQISSSLVTCIKR